MKEHEHVLRLASRGKLPETINSASHPSVTVVRELVEAGYLKAIDSSSQDGAAYLSPRITLAGREYLARLRERPTGRQTKPMEPSGEPPGLGTGVSGGRGAWQEIRREYGVSKGMVGKRISFVKDEFKRRVIFRDIEQAFLLAQCGFYKPSLILAGGVIEELLRVYLAHKDVQPERDNLDSYIRACEKNRLIKGPIHQLADSVRQFRNIVHLQREATSKHTISKATAKGAVSSVFTIANELAT
jgi:hypothetical protein